MLQLGRFPRVRLGHMPTPLEPLARLSSHLGWIAHRLDAADRAILAATDGAWCEMQSDGTNWIIIAGS